MVVEIRDLVCSEVTDESKPPLKPQGRWFLPFPDSILELYIFCII